MDNKNNTHKIPTELINKYNIPSPRYTSYPPVPVWQGISEENWIQNLNLSLSHDNSLSIYLHVPFCRELCSFCGCNKMITKDKSKGAEYLHLIKKEWDLLSQKLKVKPKIKEMHLGGGSPTWLSHDELDELISFFLDSKKFDFNNQDLELSIELDPRTTTKEQIEVLKKHHFTRASIGVQDVHEDVLMAIRRNQDFKTVKQVFQWLHDADIKLINIDLIYGLPNQTPLTILESLKLVNTLKPTRIAFYSYAHLPSLRPAQKIVERFGLPTAEEKRKLYEIGKKYLLENGYIEIGMDHFASNEDELFSAYNEGKLHRNFMGYTVQYSNNLLGFGPSSLSSTELAFSQNEKDYKLWKNLVLENKIPIIHGHLLSKAEKQKQLMVLDLMCHFKTSLKNIELPDWQKENLEKLKKDQLIEFKDDYLYATDLGKIFIRNICMAIDDSYRPNNKHSSSI